MGLGVVFPPGLGDEPAPALNPQECVQPSPFDPDGQSVMPSDPIPEPDPNQSHVPGPLDPAPFDPTKLCHPPEDQSIDHSLDPPTPALPKLPVDLSGIDDKPAPVIHPAPATKNPFDFWTQ